MEKAAWIFLAFPSWYFATILDPFREGFLTMVPALGVLCVGVGVILGIGAREAGLLLYALPPAASQILVAFAGFMSGTLRDTASHPFLLGFLLLQFAAVAYLFWRLKGARWPAAALTGFSLSYALSATFAAVMAFNNDWL